jgi:hypothetical protein
MNGRTYGQATRLTTPLNASPVLAFGSASSCLGKLLQKPIDFCICRIWRIARSGADTQPTNMVMATAMPMLMVPPNITRKPRELDGWK